MSCDRKAVCNILVSPARRPLGIAQNPLGYGVVLARIADLVARTIDLPLRQGDVGPAVNGRPRLGAAGAGVRFAIGIFAVDGLDFDADGLRDFRHVFLLLLPLLSEARP